MVDKNQAIIDFLITCPQIRANPLFFNFINAKNNTKQIITIANDVVMNRPYIDGTVLKRYSCSLVDFRSVSTQAIVKEDGYPNENVDDMLDVQSIIDWVNEQADAKNYPDFGNDAVIDDMQVMTNAPNLNGIDSSVSPPLAKYSFTILITYLDTSKKLWN